MLDTHCHLADEAFREDLDAAVARARAAGVSSSLCILAADSSEELDRSRDVALAWPGVWFSAGIHPHRSGAYAARVDDVAGVVSGAVDRVGAVAIGEIGLDYHYDPAPRSDQQAVFRAQVGVALERDLPVVIHTREAMPDTLEILREAGPRLRSVLHCFTGTIAEAEAGMALGAYVSLSGIATFPKAGNLRELAAMMPADRLLLETDSPYLAPVPHRGKRNEPAWVSATYAVVAGARGTTVEELGALVMANFQRFLGSPAPARLR